MDEYVSAVGNQEIICKYMAPLSSAWFAKQLAYWMEPGLCAVPSYIGFYNKSPAQYSGLARNIVRLGPMSLFQRGTDPATSMGMVFKITTFEKVGVKKEDVACGIDTVAIGYRYLYTPNDENAPVMYGEFKALRESDIAGFNDGVIVCVVEMASGGSGPEVVRVDSRYAHLSTNLLRSQGFLNDVNLSPALPGSGIVPLKSTVVLRSGNKQAVDHTESLFDGSVGLVKRRVVQSQYNFANHAAGVYVLGCVVLSESVVGDGPLPLVCSGGGANWFSEVTGGNKKAALERALQNVPFGVVVFGAVYWDGVSLLTSEFFNVKRTFADVVKRIQDVLKETKDFAQGLNEAQKEEFDEHEASRAGEGNSSTAKFSHVALDSVNKNGLSISNGLLSMGKAGTSSLGTVKVPTSNGLSVTAEGSVGLAVAQPSVGSVGGSNGALVAGDKEKLDQYPYKEATPSGSKFLNGEGGWATPPEVTKSANGYITKLPDETTTEKYYRQDGAWVKPPNSVYSHPSGFATKTDGLYSFAVNGAGHVSAGNEITASSGVVFSGNDIQHDSGDSFKHVSKPAEGDVGKVLKAGAGGTYGWDADYTHPTTPGSKHVPAGGSSGKILKWEASGEAQWADNPVFTAATATADGSSGLVPKPSKGDQGKLLSGGGKWFEAAPASATLTEDAGSSGLPAVVSTAITSILQTIRNCLKWLVDKANNHTHDDRYYTETEMSGAFPNTAISIPNGADLNSYTSPGFYFAVPPSVKTLSNTPWGVSPTLNAVSFSMTVVKHAGVTQILNVYVNSGWEYQRTYDGETWDVWVRTARISDLPTSVTSAEYANTAGSLSGFGVSNRFLNTGSGGITTVTGYSITLSGNWLYFNTHRSLSDCYSDCDCTG
jgi:hypothetical protein